MTIAANALKVTGIVLYLYLVWRNLRRDYDSNNLIGYGWLSVLAWLVGGRLGYGLINWGAWNDNWWKWIEFWQYSGINYLSAYLLWFLLTWWWCVGLKWKLWQFLEDVVGGLVVLVGLGILAGSLWPAAACHRPGVGVESLVYLIIIVIGGILAGWLRGKYRSFFWYRSGKKGFVFLAANLLVFALLAIYWWLVGRWWEGNLAMTLGLLSGVGLVILGKED